MSQRRFLTVLGAVLFAVGAVVLLSGGFDVPSRRPPQVIRIAGTSQLLLAVAPAVAGIALVHVGMHPERRDSRLVQALVAGAVGACIAAFLVAQRY